MLVNIVIICLFHSTNAIFHHHKTPSHTRIHVCLTPPNTMFKVQKHITECQHEVKSNIFEEAFSLINEHAFHHPNDHAPIDIGAHDEFAHRNFTSTEQEVLNFFEEHEPYPGTVGKLSGGSSHLNSNFDVSHEHPLDHSIEEHEHVPHQPHQPHQSHQPHLYAWHQRHPPHFNKKTDAIELNKPEEVVHSSPTPKRNPFTYFNIKTGEASKRNDRHPRDIHKSDVKKSDFHVDIHSDIHPE